MESVSTNLIDIIYQLLPGFIVAWVIYGYTACLKPAPFERIVQALIFTIFVKFFHILVKAILFALGKYISLGEWTENSNLLLSVIIALFLGIVFSWAINNDFPNYFLRNDGDEKTCNWFKPIQKFLARLKITNKTLHPSEWYSALNDSTNYVVLHLDGERRLMGWLYQYPDDPEHGHFIIKFPSWLTDEGEEKILVNVKYILISVKEVIRIEFIEDISQNKENEVNNVHKCAQYPPTPTCSGPRRSK